MRCSTQGMAFPASISGQGSGAVVSARSRSAMPRVADHRPSRQFEIEGGADQIALHFEQAFGERQQFRLGQAAMPLVHRCRERIADAGLHPDQRRLRDAEPVGDRIGRLEPDAADVARQPVWVLAHHLDGIGP